MTETLELSGSDAKQNGGRLWEDYIFKDRSYIDRVLELKMPLPDGREQITVPGVLGSGIPDIIEGNPRGQKLVLFLNDPTGEAFYERHLLHKSLRLDENHEDNRDKKKSKEKVVLESGIILHIADAFNDFDHAVTYVKVEEPKILFKIDEGKWSTSVLFYGENQVHLIEDDSIRGVRSGKKGESSGPDDISDVCSVLMPAHPKLITECSRQLIFNTPDEKDYLQTIYAQVGCNIISRFEDLRKGSSERKVYGEYGWYEK